MTMDRRQSLDATTSNPVRPYLDATSELDAFVHLAWAGLGYAKVATEVTQTVREIRSRREGGRESLDAQLPEHFVRHTAMLGRFAAEQEPRGFPYLYAIATVRLWTILESSVEELVIRMLLEYPESWGANAIQKLRGPLVEFAKASPSERAEYLADQLKQEVKAVLKPGVGRFEALLEAIGLGGPVDDSVRRALLELSEVRNVIVHRAGRVDAKLLERCPWLSLLSGSVLTINGGIFNRFVLAAHWYMIELDDRWDQFASPNTVAPTHEKAKAVQQSIAAKLSL